MADLGHLRAFIDAMGLVGLKTANRVGSALTDAEANNYTFQKAASDTLGFYNDLLVSWIGLASGTTVVPVPRVTMQVSLADNPTAADATITLGIASGVSLDTTALGKITLPAAPAIAKTRVTADATNAPDVGIHIDLSTPPALNLTVGLYDGLVFDTSTGDGVVEILLRVVP